MAGLTFLVPWPPHQTGFRPSRRLRPVRAARRWPGGTPRKSDISCTIVLSKPTRRHRQTHRSDSAATSAPRRQHGNMTRRHAVCSPVSTIDTAAALDTAVNGADLARLQTAPAPQSACLAPGLVSALHGLHARPAPVGGGTTRPGVSGQRRQTSPSRTAGALGLCKQAVWTSA